jgi:DNA-binding response OmpR family regulator
VRSVERLAHSGGAVIVQPTSTGWTSRTRSNSGLNDSPGAPLEDEPAANGDAATTPRILVVEDDAVLLRVLGDNLIFEGFAVECLRDGDRIVDSVRSFAPDLVVLDVQLPRRDGFTLCGMLRRVSGIPIIMLSARSQKADKLCGLRVGADDYVTKPFDLEELIARIRAILRRTRPAGLTAYGDSIAVAR